MILHRQGDHNCHTFRIPGIARSNAGTLLAVYDLRYDSRRDLQGHMDIGLPFSNLICSRDHGKTWTVSSPARSDTNGRAISVTSDLGLTWKVHPSDHGAPPEPVCMASLISHSLPDGRRALFFSNPNHKTRRANMTVRASLDDGATWPSDRQIALDTEGGSYSSLVMVDDRTVGILYESSRADLEFQTISLDEFGL